MEFSQETIDQINNWYELSKKIRENNLNKWGSERSTSYRYVSLLPEFDLSDDLLNDPFGYSQKDMGKTESIGANFKEARNAVPSDPAKGTVAKGQKVEKLVK